MVRQHSPQRFDHAVREYNVDLGQDALDRAASNEGIHICVEVLDPAVHEHRGDYSSPVIIARMTATSLDVNWLGLDFGHDGTSVNPHLDLLTQAWYRLRDQRLV